MRSSLARAARAFARLPIPNTGGGQRLPARDQESGRSRVTAGRIPAIRHRVGAGLLPAEFPRSGIGCEPDYCRPNSRDQVSGGSRIAAASAREGGGAGERARGPGCAPRRLCGYGSGRGLETQRVGSRMGGCWIRTGTGWRRRMNGCSRTNAWHFATFPRLACLLSKANTVEGRGWAEGRRGGRRAGGEETKVGKK